MYSFFFLKDCTKSQVLCISQSKDFMMCFQVWERKHISEMGKKKSIGGRPCKKKRAGSQIASKTELVPLDGPASTNIQPVFPEPETTGQGQPGFPDGVYLLASIIFQNNHLEKPGAHRLVNFGNERGLPLPEVKGVEMQRTSYQLAFNTLKCECLSDRWSSMDLIYLLPMLFFLLPFLFFCQPHINV